MLYFHFTYFVLQIILYSQVACEQFISPRFAFKCFCPEIKFNISLEPKDITALLLLLKEKTSYKLHWNQFDDRVISAQFTRISFYEVDEIIRNFTVRGYRSFTSEENLLHIKVWKNLENFQFSNG